MVRRGPIWCLPHESTNRCGIWPKWAHQSSVLRWAASWTSSCEEINAGGGGGCSCKCQCDIRIVSGPFYSYSNREGHFCKTSSTGALLPVDGPTWSSYGPELFIVFLFPFLPELKKF
jgi:hypothetical protein